MSCQAYAIEFGHHTQGRLGHAVICPVGGHRVAADGGNGNDFWRLYFTFFNQVYHPPGCLLAQKERSLQVGGH